MTHNPEQIARKYLQAGDFHDNPIIYHIITDRFAREVNGKAASLEPAPDDDSVIGAFHGGQFAGITCKLREGWFTRLGVNALLISAPYQQILGWVPGAGKEFRHYAYHGYYALDYTVVDARFGTEDELTQLVSCAHDLGIRVMLDVVMNHPGYPDLMSLDVLDIDAIKSGWEQATPYTFDTFIDYGSPAFAQWWGRDWVRAKIAGYHQGGSDELTMLLADLPDFRTESEDVVRLPAFFAKMHGSKAAELPNTSVRGYLIEWLTQWVRQYGIDGFRCDSAKHVELDAWLALKTHALSALAQWKSANAHLKVDDAPFWMTGEVFGNGVESTDFFDFGFDNLINFDFQYQLAADCDLDTLFSRYASQLQGRPLHNVLSYASSHDTFLFDRTRLRQAGTALLLAPGGVQIFYGDESARLPGPHTPSDAAQATRSDMNWDTVDTALFDHWSLLGRFRARHVALARGEHRRLGEAPYVFSRVDAESGDVVIVAPDARGEVTIQVGTLFREGADLHDACSGWRGHVCEGQVVLTATGMILLEIDDFYG